jgi:hypothetical protein
MPAGPAAPFAKNGYAAGTLQLPSDERAPVDSWQPEPDFLTGEIVRVDSLIGCWDLSCAETCQPMPTTTCSDLLTFQELRRLELTAGTASAQLHPSTPHRGGSRAERNVTG